MMLTAPPLIRNTKSDPPAITTPSAATQAMSTIGFDKQRRGDGGRQVAPLEREQRDGLCADDQGDQENPAKQRRRDQQFEQ